MTNNLKIFVVYNKPAKVFHSDVFEPIQSGAAGARHDLGMLKDNTGDNISGKNCFYSELTVFYWVWKNWLPAHPEVRSVGFCHYRRFLDFSELRKDDESERPPFQPILIPDFVKKFDTYDDVAIEKFATEHELILPNPEYFDISMFEQFAMCHPTDDLVAFREIFMHRYPEDIAVYDSVWSDRKMYPALNFVMTRERFTNLCEWLFGLLFEFEQQSDFSRYADAYTRRMPGFIAERMLTVWLTLQKPPICHVGSWLLHKRIPEPEYKKSALRQFFHSPLKFLRSHGYFGCKNKAKLVCPCGNSL